MKKSIAIVANGNLSEMFVGEIRHYDVIIGVDRGAYWLLTHGIAPHIAVGDFDSCTSKEWKKIQENITDVRQFDAEKNFTDTELALDIAMKKNSQHIAIYGGMGTRIDHTMATISLLARCAQARTPAVVRDMHNDVRIIGRGRTIIKKRAGCTYISIIPYTKQIIVSLSGLKYPLNRKKITQSMTLGISNEFEASEAEVTVHGGLALVIQSRD